MIRWCVLLFVLLASPVLAQSPVTFASDRVTGTFAGLSPSTLTGDIKGTVEQDGRLKLTIQLQARNATDLSRSCVGEGRFSGLILPNGVFRWTADQVTSSTP